MSKKKVLNEVRRFMKLANLNANVSSTFINKIEEGEMPSYMRDDEDAELQEEIEDEIEVEDEIELEEPAGLEGEMEMDMEMDVDMEEEAVISDEEADILIALGQKLAAAQELGAEEDVEGALDDLDAADELEDEADDLEMDAADDLSDAADDIADETLEEILNGILDEDEAYTAKKEKPGADMTKRDKKRGAEGTRAKTKGHGKVDYVNEEADELEEDQGYDDEEDESLGMRRGKEADKEQSEKDRRDDSYGKWGSRGHRERMRNRKRAIPKLRNEEAVVQEVLKRVRARLTQMAKK